MLLIMVLKS